MQGIYLAAKRRTGQAAGHGNSVSIQHLASLVHVLLHTFARTITASGGALEVHVNSAILRGAFCVDDAAFPGVYY